MKNTVKEIAIVPPFIKLEQFLKFCGVAETGGHAKILIQNGDVSINGEPCFARGKKLFTGDIVEIKEHDCGYRVVFNDN